MSPPRRTLCPVSHGCPRKGPLNGDMPSPATTPADVLVIFGITGDLARRMTFRALYRLERRGLLDCPIIGVASDDLNTEQLVKHAREAIVDSGLDVDDAVFDRLARRMSYRSGDVRDASLNHTPATE